jgi:hypothetical protein
MAAPTHTPRTSWIEEGLRAPAAGGPDAVRIEVLAKALDVTKVGFYWGRPEHQGFRLRSAFRAREHRRL